MLAQIYAAMMYRGVGKWRSVLFRKDENKIYTHVPRVRRWSYKVEEGWKMKIVLGVEVFVFQT